MRVRWNEILNYCKYMKLHCERVSPRLCQYILHVNALRDVQLEGHVDGGS